MDDRIDPSAADAALERREVGDVRNGEIGLAIEIRAISGGEIVYDHDVVAASEERVDDVAAEKAGAAGDEDTQLLAAPLPMYRAICTSCARQLRWLVVDELVEEMVDKGPTRRSDSTLASRRRGGASAAHQVTRRRASSA
jgi:hypothetical protein